MSEALDPTTPMQVAAAAALLAHAGVAGIAGKAVYAPHQAFPDVYPRVTLEIPQVVGIASTCDVPAEVYLTVHSWAKGADATLTAGRLASAVHACLIAPFAVDGHQVVTRRWELSRPAGDPDPLVAHQVTTVRFLTVPLA